MKAQLLSHPAGQGTMKNVLFLCIGNSCRSPMAEGFARAYGSDVIEPVSAGLAPAAIIQPLTKQVMEAKNISLEDQHAKDLSQIDLQNIDLIVNMSGRPLPPDLPVEVREWRIRDPIGCDEATYVAIRDQIEHLIMGLILDLRRENRPAKRPPSLRSMLGRGSGVSR
jgi:arsenate reductase (thioredoxin)